MFGTAGVGACAVGHQRQCRTVRTKRRPPFRRQYAVETETDIEIELTEIVHITYKVGDKVVYPHHGAGKVLKKEKKEMSRM